MVTIWRLEIKTDEQLKRVRNYHMTASSVFLHQSQSCDTVPLQYINYIATLLWLFWLQEGRLGMFLDERQGGIGVSIPHLHVVRSLQIHPEDKKKLKVTLKL